MAETVFFPRLSGASRRHAENVTHPLPGRVAGCFDWQLATNNWQLGVGIPVMSGKGKKEGAGEVRGEGQPDDKEERWQERWQGGGNGRGKPLSCPNRRLTVKIVCDGFDIAARRFILFALQRFRCAVGVCWRREGAPGQIWNRGFPDL
jgi:hypothetical protein